MTRDYFIHHLINCDCYPDDTYDVPGVAQMWRNGINGEMCTVPYEDELTVPTWGHIVYELKIDPPLHDGHDSDYAVYSSFRETRLKQHLETRKKQEDN